MHEQIRLRREHVARLADAIAETAAHIDAATHRFLTQIREFDLTEGWGTQGALSCAHWLAWRVGMGLGTAREHLRVAHALAELPLIDDALRHGELSYCKVRAVTRVATKENEELLLTIARKTTGAQLEKLCRLYRPVQAAGEKAMDEDTSRYVTERFTQDGMVAIQIRVRPEEAPRLLKAFDAYAENGKRVDGAVALAEAGLLGKLGVEAKAAAGEEIADAPKVRPPVEVVIHVSAEDLSGATDQGDGLSVETCRRMLCDSGVVPMLEDGAGKTIDVGRKTRTIRRLCAGRWSLAMVAAGSRAVAIGGLSMRITSSTGSMVGRLRWRTRCCCVGGTTAICMSMGIGSRLGRMG
jgi:hypothetical protein